MDTGKTGRAGAWLAVGQEIAELLDQVNAEAFARLLDFCAVEDCRWFFSGQGRSGLSAQMAAMRFTHLGRKTHFVGEVTSPSIRKGDRLVMASGSGETPVSANFVKIAKQEGASVALLTYRTDSTIAGMADVVLEVPSLGSKQFGGSLFEQSVLILLDSVVFDLASRIPNAHEKMMHRHTNLQ